VQQEAKLPDFDALWDYNRPDETERKFRDLLQQAQAGGNRSYRLQLLTQIARTQGLQRKFDDAHKTLDEVEKGLTDGLKRARVRYLLERGRVYNSSKQPEKARPLFLEAWDAARAASEESLAVDAAHMMAIIEPTEKQLDWNLKALEMAEKSADAGARKWKGSLYNNIGWTYHDQGGYTKALEMFERGLAFRLEQGNAETIRIARWTVARALRSLGRVEEALKIQTDLLEVAEKTNTPDGFINEEMGECLLALKEEEAARPHFKRAYELLSKDAWLVESEPKRLERMKKLGNDRI
jgi:tetratricopeptide (TPR) repeat protein